jgi:hypothetical protein
MAIGAVLLGALLLTHAAPTTAATPEPVQHGAQPNPGEVRPPNPQGNAPSSATGTLTTDPSPTRPLGVSVGMLIAVGALGVLVAALWLYSRRVRAGPRSNARPPSDPA